MITVSNNLKFNNFKTLDYPHVMAKANQIWFGNNKVLELKSNNRIFYNMDVIIAIAVTAAVMDVMDVLIAMAVLHVIDAQIARVALVVICVKAVMDMVVGAVQPVTLVLQIVLLAVQVA